MSAACRRIAPAAEPVDTLEALVSTVPAMRLNSMKFLPAYKEKFAGQLSLLVRGVKRTRSPRAHRPANRVPHPALAHCV
jgi:hypothetical protein